MSAIAFPKLHKDRALATVKMSPAAAQILEAYGVGRHALAEVNAALDEYQKTDSNEAKAADEASDELSAALDELLCAVVQFLRAETRD